MPSSLVGPYVCRFGWTFHLTYCLCEQIAKVLARLRRFKGSHEPLLFGICKNGGFHIKWLKWLKLTHTVVIMRHSPHWNSAALYSWETLNFCSSASLPCWVLTLWSWPSVVPGLGLVPGSLPCRLWWLGLGSGHHPEEIYHCCNYSKVQKLRFYFLSNCPKGIGRMANSVEPDQTFTGIRLYQYLGPLQ